MANNPLNLAFRFFLEMAGLIVTLGALVLLHYALSWDRIAWLLETDT